MTYKEQLAHPKWQKKRLRIFERDNFKCQLCLDSETQLQVHHKKYDYGKLAWEYPDHNFQTLCKDCHKALTDHIEEYGNDKEFGTLRISPDSIISYSNGMLKLPVNPLEETLEIQENNTHKIVQFLINNWLKNG